MGAPGVMAGGLDLLGCRSGPTMWWMDCLANFEPPQPDFLPCLPIGEDGWLGGPFLSFQGSGGGPWVHIRGTCPPWTWMRADNAVDGLSGKLWAALTWLYAWNLTSVRQLFWEVFSVFHFWGSDGGPWSHGWKTLPPGTWMRPNDAVKGLSGKFWAATTWLKLCETLLGEDGWFWGYLPSFWGSFGDPWDNCWGTWPPGTWMRPNSAFIWIIWPWRLYLL